MTSAPLSRRPVTTHCRFLGDDPPPSLLDQDIFRFTGAKGETVTLTLAPDPDTGQTSQRATLLLTDQIAGAVFVRLDSSACPTPCRPRCPRRAPIGDGGRTPQPAAWQCLSGPLLCDPDLVRRCVAILRDHGDRRRAVAPPSDRGEAHGERRCSSPIPAGTRDAQGCPRGPEPSLAFSPPAVWTARPRSGGHRGQPRSPPGTASRRGWRPGSCRGTPGVHGQPRLRHLPSPDLAVAGARQCCQVAFRPGANTHPQERYGQGLTPLGTGVCAILQRTSGQRA